MINAIPDIAKAAEIFFKTLLFFTIEPPFCRGMGTLWPIIPGAHIHPRRTPYISGEIYARHNGILSWFDVRNL